MPVPLHSIVRLLVDDFRHEGVVAGAIGVVLLEYDDACEVEFSDPEGTTIAMFVVPIAALELIAGPGLPEPASGNAST